MEAGDYWFVVNNYTHRPPLLPFSLSSSCVLIQKNCPNVRRVPSFCSFFLFWSKLKSRNLSTNTHTHTHRETTHTLHCDDERAGPFCSLALCWSFSHSLTAERRRKKKKGKEKKRGRKCKKEEGELNCTVWSDWWPPPNAAASLLHSLAQEQQRQTQGRESQKTRKGGGGGGKRRRQRRDATLSTTTTNQKRIFSSSSERNEKGRGGLSLWGWVRRWRERRSELWEREKDAAMDIYGVGDG